MNQNLDKPQTETADENFTEADGVREIAQQLIAKYHPHLRNARIAYLFDLREEPSLKGGKAVVAKTQKAGGLLRLFSQSDFVITIHGETWEKLSEPQQMATVDHELCHCGLDADDQWFVKAHDAEEFRAVIERHGFWQNDIKSMAETVQRQFEFMGKTA